MLLLWLWLLDIYFYLNVFVIFEYFFIIICNVCFRWLFKSMFGKKVFKLYKCELYWCEYEIFKFLRKYKNDFFLLNYCNNSFLCVYVICIVFNLYECVLKGFGEENVYIVM